MKARGFTLIELLIVAGVISILAAIAVPNFLEAQVRAKVSRTASDLRTLATGLEAYRVDNNVYPRATLNQSINQRLLILQSPITYVTDLPADPFFRETREGLAGFTPDYVYASGNIYFGVINQFDNSIYRGTIWSLAGRGPDGNINVGGYCMAHPVAVERGTGIFGSYDPTNGTVSPGDILRLSPGTMGANQ